MKLKDKVRIKLTLASGPIECEAIVTRYEPPPKWSPESPPIIWVRPKGFHHDVSIIPSEIAVD